MMTFLYIAFGGLVGFMILGYCALVVAMMQTPKNTNISPEYPHDRRR